jgi:hypothetical protein
MNTALTESKLQANAGAEMGEQYSLAKIMGIWASIALPMGLIHWVVGPILIPRVHMEPGFLYLILITLGLVWEGVLAYMILRREVKPFTWANIKDRVWLHTPTNPKTGVPSKWLYLWTIPLLVVIEGGNQVLDPLNGPWVKALPFLAPPSYTEIGNLAGPAGGGDNRIQLSGGRGVDLPGNLVAENERRVREVGLYRQQHSVRGIPPA